MTSEAPTRVTLPRRHWGEGLDVSQLSDFERKRLGLAHSGSIIDVVGRDDLVREAVEYALHKRLINFDTETTGLVFYRDKIKLIQLGDAERQYLIWKDTVDISPITWLLGNADVCKAGVNLKYDLKMWMAEYGRDARAHNVADALICEQVLCCGLLGNPGMTLKLTSMGAMAKRWLGLQLPKDEALRTGWGAMTPGDWDSVPRGQEKRLYAADDVVMPTKLLKVQHPWLEYFDLLRTVNLEHMFLPVLADSEIQGINLNLEQWMELYREADERQRQAFQQLDVLFNVTKEYRVTHRGEVEVERDKNYASTDQLPDLIREYMSRQYNVDVICTNRHFREALEATGQVNQARLDLLFQPRLEPNPDKPGKNKRVAGPNMSDVVAKTWPLYRQFLPYNTFFMPDTESPTFKEARIVWDTASDQRDRKLWTHIGLPDELVAPILEFRESTKLKSTYGDGWIARVAEATGRLHTEFLQAALTTGRLSSSPNVQNLPRDERYRACFVARPGYKFVGLDFSQIEPRVIAHMSQDPMYMRVFWSERPGTEGFRRWCHGVTEELDLYTEVGKSVEVIPKHFTKKDVKGDTARPEGKDGRQQSKVIVLGLGYGTGIGKFWRTLMRDTGRHYPWDYAAKLFRAYWDTVPMVKHMLDTASALADPETSPRRAYHPYLDKEVTWSESLLGRKRFFAPDSTNTYTEGRNHPIQATAGGDILKHTAVAFTHWMWTNGIDGTILNYIHDEFLVEVREDQAEAAHAALGDYMRIVGEQYCPTVPIAASGYIDDYWVKD